MFQDYTQTFDSTIKNLQETGRTKLEGRDLDRKIDQLSSKNYLPTISKLQSDLTVLKEENAKMLYTYQVNQQQQGNK